MPDDAALLEELKKKYGAPPKPVDTDAVHLSELESKYGKSEPSEPAVTVADIRYKVFGDDYDPDLAEANPAPKSDNRYIEHLMGRAPALSEDERKSRYGNLAKDWVDQKVVDEYESVTGQKVNRKALRTDQVRRATGEAEDAHAKALPAGMALAAHLGRTVASATTLGLWKGGLTDYEDRLVSENPTIQGPAGSAVGAAGTVLAAANPLGPVAGLTKAAGVLRAGAAAPAIGFGVATGLEHDSVAAGLEAAAFVGAAGPVGKLLKGKDPGFIRRVAGEAAAVLGVGAGMSVAKGEKIDWSSQAAQAALFGVLSGFNASPLTPRSENLKARDRARQADTSDRLTDRPLPFDPAVANRPEVAESPPARVETDATDRLVDRPFPVDPALAVREAVVDPRDAATAPVEAPSGGGGAAPETRPVAEPVAAPGTAAVPDRESPEWKAEVAAAVEHGMSREAAESIADEVVAPNPDVTANKRRIMDADREARGQGPHERGPVRPHDALQDEAAATLDKTPDAGRDILRDLNKTGRVPTDTDYAVLLEHRRRLYGERDALDAEGAKAALEGKTEKAQMARDAADAREAELTESEKIVGEAKTRSGQSLAALRMEIARDYSPEAIENKVRRARDYEPLNKDERVEIAEIAAKVKDATENRAAHEAKKVAEEAGRVVDGLIKGAETEKPSGENATLYGKKNKIVTREDYEKTKAELRKMLGDTTVGSFKFLDPTILAKVVKLGAFHVEAGARSFVAWARSMKEDVGDVDEAELRKIWNASRKATNEPTIESVTGKYQEARDAGKGRSTVDATAGKLAELVIADKPGQGRDAIVKRVHEILSSVEPDLTISDVHRAISGYGKVRELNMDPVKVELRDTKAQLQQIAKLEDMARIDDQTPGKAPLKSGAQRQAASDATRELIRLVNEAKRKGGYDTPDPEKALRSALESQQTRMLNRIKDMRKERDAGVKDVPVKSDPLKNASPEQRAKHEAIKAEYEAEVALYRETFGRPELTDAQRLDMAIKATEKSIAELERRAEAGDVFPAAKESKTPNDPRLDALQKRREALRERIKDIRDSATPRGETADQRDVRVDQEARERDAKKAEAEIASIDKTVAELKRRVEAGDVFGEKKAAQQGPLQERVAELRQQRDELRQIAADMRDAATPRKSILEKDTERLKSSLNRRLKQLNKIADEGAKAKGEKREVYRDPEAIRLDAEIIKAKKRADERIFQDHLANRTRAQRIGAAALEASSTARAVMTGLDFSAVLRQGGFIAMAHPARAYRALGDMFRAFRSSDAMLRSEAEIAARPNYTLARRAGLFLAEHGETTLAKMEEAYQSRWAQHIPGVAGSQRAYTAFLNRLRMDSFDAAIGNLSRGVAPTLAEAKAIADYVNVATGRGGGAGGTKFNNALVGLNSVFFSPRLVASRFQLLFGQPAWGGTARTRVLVAKEYARFMLGVSVVYGLASLAGGKIEKDGKIRFGNTYLDPLAGISQVTKIVVKNIVGLVDAIRGRKPDSRLGEKDWQFFRSKFAPIPGAILDLASGKNVVGDRVKPSSALGGLVTPMTFRGKSKDGSYAFFTGGDLYQAARENGVPSGVALGILNLLGMGVQNYRKGK